MPLADKSRGPPTFAPMLSCDAVMSVVASVKKRKISPIARHWYCARNYLDMHSAISAKKNATGFASILRRAGIAVNCLHYVVRDFDEAEARAEYQSTLDPQAGHELIGKSVVSFT